MASSKSSKPSTAPANPTLSIKAAITESWEKLKPSLGTYVLAAAILIVESYAFERLRDFLNPDAGHINGTYILVTFAIWLINAMVAIGLIRMTLKDVDGKKPKLSDLTYSFSSGSMLWQYLVTQLAVFVMTVIGTIVVIIPGIYLALTYGMAQFFVVDQDLTVKEALRASNQAMQGNRLRFLGLVVLLALINIVGIIIVGVGLLITIPLSILALSHAYRQLAGGQPVVTAKPALVLEPAA